MHLVESSNRVFKTTNNFQIEFKNGSVYINGVRNCALGIAVGFVAQSGSIQINKDIAEIQSLVSKYGSERNKRRFAIYK